jgi:transmembrane sensor
MSRAADIEQRAATWLIRREEDRWSDADEAAFTEWLQSDHAHKAAYWRLEHGWRAADRIAALGASPADTGRADFRDRRRAWLPAALAASLLLLAFGLSTRMLDVSFGARSPHPVGIETALGARKVIDLSDGSRIELNTSTAVRAEVGEGRRAVWLDRGEAFFDIAKRNGEPFVVYAGPRTITVLGTRFSVRRAGQSVVVAVVEGRVRIEDSSVSAPIRSAVISAGDVAVADGPSTLIATKSDEQVQDRLAWRQNMLVFDNITLADAAAEFNRYNSRKLVIEDPATAQIRIGGTFQTRNVDAFVRLLQQAYGLDVEQESGSVKISA